MFGPFAWLVGVTGSAIPEWVPTNRTNDLLAWNWMGAANLDKVA